MKESLKTTIANRKRQVMVKSFTERTACLFSLDYETTFLKQMSWVACQPSF